MTYTAENMSRLLGSAADDKDAEQFAEYLISHGWELLENSDGYLYPYRDGEAMTEAEWQAALFECFSD